MALSQRNVYESYDVPYNKGKVKGDFVVILGYARVSTQDQNLGLQLEALKQAGVSTENIYVERVSGSIDPRKRPVLSSLLRRLKKGDTLVVWKLDRLGRNALDLLELDKRMRRREVHLRSITEELNTATPLGKLYYTILATIAEMERGVLVERVKAGLEVARAEGRVGGRRFKLEPERQKELADAYSSGVTLQELKKRFKINTPTIYRYLRANNVTLRGQFRGHKLPWTTACATYNGSTKTI